MQKLLCTLLVGLKRKHPLASLRPYYTLTTTTHTVGETLESSLSPGLRPMHSYRVLFLVQPFLGFLLL